jgi:SAM-dependent methyltransferase
MKQTDSDRPNLDLFTWLRDLLREPRLAGVDLDSDELLTVHRQVLQEKPMMNEVFGEFYDLCLQLDRAHFGDAVGHQVEIGAGVSFFKQRHPGIISTDIKSAPNLDMVVDAQAMPFERNSVRAIYGINCFHHLPDPNRFFSELERVLADGGGCVLIDPHFGWVAERFYRRLFDSETFDKSQLDWVDPSLGFMYGANQALSYLVFVRDRRLFLERFPGLEIVHQKPLDNYLRYLLSGGLNFRQILPSWCSAPIRMLEWMLAPLRNQLALHHTIVIRKRSR